MTSEVFILGQIGKAVFEQDDRYFVLDLDVHPEPVECRAGDVSLFFDSGSEVSVVTSNKLDLAAIGKTLDFETRAYRALSMTLGGLDNELSSETRGLCVEAAEEFLQDDAVRGFVWKRLSARPLPVTANIQGAIELAETADAFLVSSLYQETLKSQPAIEVMLEAWKEVCPDYFDSNEETAAGERVLIDTGAFAEEVSALASNDLTRLNSVVVSYGTNRELVKVIPRATHLLNAIRRILIGKVATVAKNISEREQRRIYSELEKADNEFEVGREAEISAASITQLLEEFDKRPRDWRPSRGYEVEERIQNQIAAVGKLIRNGDLARANEFLYGLVKFHLEHSDKEHVAMSLCSLAKTALDVRTFEIAEDLVEYAVSLKVDDAFIWTAKAEIVRTKAQFDSALKIYKDTMQRFPENQVARNGYSEVLKEMGQLDTALTAYQETMLRFPEDVVARNGYAEVLKDLGQVETALSVYQETMLRFPNDVFVRCGYADVLKDLGQLETALTAYQETMLRFPKNAFARNGYADVLKDLGQLETALSAYQETMLRFPDDVVARNGYADVLKDLGQLEHALKVYQETMQRFPFDLVARRGRSSLLVVMDRFAEAESLLFDVVELKPASRDYWIGSHILAMSLLKQGKVDEAIVRLEEGWFGAQWVDVKDYFRNALAVARIKKKEFAKALEGLNDNVVYLDVFQMQKRLALVAHSQAELGQVDAASAALEEIKTPGNPHVIILKDALTSRFRLNPEFQEKLPVSEIERLETQIDQEEFFLAIAA